MRKAIFLSSVLLVLAVGMNSCKKCYNCTLDYHTTNAAGNDSLVHLNTQVCNHGTNGAGANLNIAVSDMETNGYVCTAQ